MDIHRSRFVPYPSSAINALAFSHAEADHGQQDPDSLRLAIGRANGNIEIWNPKNGAWLQEKVFYGGKDRSVEGLAWTQEPDHKDAQHKLISGPLRLFSIGYSSSVTDEVWCFAVQPRRRKPLTGGSHNDNGVHQNLVAGCADGTIVLLSTELNDLTFNRFVSRATNKKARALSIAYKDNDIVLAGFADSMIRVFDTRNGNVIRNISLGNGPVGGPKEILVWKVKCLSNGDFVSGDSTGEIRIYNGKNYSQTQRIAGHEADVLDLAVSRDGASIFSAGMDRRTCFYTSRKPANKVEGHIGKWRKVSHQRYHQHDVKTLATYEGSKLNVVVSGGIDTQPVIVPLRQFGKELTRGLPSLPPVPPLVSAPEARLLVSWWNTELRVWRVRPHRGDVAKPKVVARLALQGEENITSASITQDGGLLAVSTISTVKLFQLMQTQADAGSSLRIRKLEMPVVDGAKTVRLSANGKWLSAISATNKIRLVRVIRSEDPSDAPRALKKLQSLERLDRKDDTLSQLRGLSGPYERSIAHAEFSTDGNVFAVADLAGYVDTWIVQGHEDPTAPEIDVDETAPAVVENDDSEDEDVERQEIITFLGQNWITNPSGHLVPRLDSTPVLLSVQPTLQDSSHPQPNGNPALHPTRHNPHPHSHELPTTNYRLLLVSAENQLYLFDIMDGRLSEWSRRNPPSSYPLEYQQLDLPAKGCIWDLDRGQQRIWLYGEKWLFMFDLTKDFSISGSDSAVLSSKKRKRLGHKNNSGAGDPVSQKEVPVTKMRKFDNNEAETGKGRWTDVNANGPDQSDEEDEMEDNSQPLAVLRRGSMQNEGQNSEEASERQKVWWHTFKYRPILGVLPIGGGIDSRAPEVVLVERPSWDLDLPPRFVGTHEA